MKKMVIVLLAGTCTLFFSTTMLANHQGHQNAYGGPGVTGGAAIWVDAYGNAQYAANVAYGVSYGYGARPDHRRDRRSSCNHRSHRAYERGYNEGYAHGKRKGHKHRKRHGRGRHGGH